MKTNDLLSKVVIIAMFSALACAGTFIQIRMPAGDFVHLGNFVMIIAALLLGGVAGGISGALGMGLYDIIYYTSKPSTIIRTFALKFLVGFAIGTIFRLILKKDINARRLLFTFSGLFFALAITFTVFFALGDKSGFGFDNGLSATYANIFGSKNSFKVSLYVPIFGYLFAIGSLVAAILSHKLTKRNIAALVAISIAVFINILGEFILRWFLEGIMVSDFNTSLIVATSKIPGSIITGFISVLLSILIYEPIYKAVKTTGYIKDDIEVDDEKETEEVKELVEHEAK